MQSSGRRTVNLGGEEIQMPPISKNHIFIGIVVLVVVVLFFTSFYTIKTEDVGVVKRFGKYTKTTMPGLHFKVPFGIETVTKVKGNRFIFREEFGYRTAKAGIRTQLRRDGATLAESLMLTGDLNIATVEWVVQYRIQDPRKYIFRYILLCPNMPAKLAGGFCFVGWNTIDSFAIAIDFNRKSLPRNWADYVTATILLHELGHTLGLFYYKFEGIDNYTCQYLLPGVWKFRNYKSCMNYAYTWFLLDYSNGRHGKNDFDDWRSIDLGFFREEIWRIVENFCC